MRKIIYFCVAATVLLQACSTGKSFSKKRYGHLKWIDHNTEVEVPGKETPATTPTDRTNRYEETNVIVPTGEKTTETVTTTPADKGQAVEYNQPVTHNTTPTSTNPAVKNTDKTVEPEVLNQPVKNINHETTTLQPTTQKEKTEPVKPMMDDTAKLIICVILAIFIPPLGMYLWDQQTDIWFVVDLILFLLILFLFFGYGFGLAGLLAVVIALLRVFELL